MNGPLAAASVSISNLDDCGLEAFICREGANLCVLKQLWCTLLPFRWKHRTTVDFRSMEHLSLCLFSHSWTTLQFSQRWSWSRCLLPTSCRCTLDWRQMRWLMASWWTPFRMWWKRTWWEMWGCLVSPINDHNYRWHDVFWKPFSWKWGQKYSLHLKQSTTLFICSICTTVKKFNVGKIFWKKSLLLIKVIFIHIQ